MAPEGGSSGAALRALLDDAVHSGATPGASCVVTTADPAGPRFAYATGRTQREPDAFDVGEHTVFDLASLTKVLSTTLLCAHAVAEGALALDEQPWPSWPGVTVRNALLHDGGLLWWAPLHERVSSFDVGLPAGSRKVIDEVLRTPLARPPGAETVYSDLGFIALGALLEERLGQRLDRAFYDVARRSYGETGLCYVPLYEEGFHPALPHVAATSYCEWRARVVQAQVNDDNAFAMGGIAGHAGLFGTAEGVEAAARFHLAAHNGSSTTPLASALRAFSSWDGARRLGYDRPTEGGTTGGAVSERGFGHLGFTGTSLWLDPEGPGEGGALYVLLTNRVCESRENQAIKQLRPAFHRAAKAWLSANL